MYRDDIRTLQEALKRIYKREKIGNDGHYCEETCRYVKRFQEMYNYLQDGIVDSSLWKSIMGEAIRTPCIGNHED
jgi:peptidoglycan hydrolase-like protein with peptidoglycan-binding domain